MIKKIELGEEIQTIEEKLEVIRLKINEMIEYESRKGESRIK